MNEIVEIANKAIKSANEAIEMVKKTKSVARQAVMLAQQALDAVYCQIFINKDKIDEAFYNELLKKLWSINFETVIDALDDK